MTSYTRVQQGRYISVLPYGDGPFIYFGNSSTGIGALYTRTAASTYKRIPIPAAAQRMASPNRLPKVIFLEKAGRIYKSINGGASWLFVANIGVQVDRLWCKNADPHVYAFVLNDGVYKDGVHAGSLLGLSGETGEGVLQSTRIFAEDTTGGFELIWADNDTFSGSNHDDGSLASSGFHVWPIYSHDEICFVARSSQFRKFTVSGAAYSTPTGIGGATVNCVRHSYRTHTCIAHCSDGSIWRSTDEGATWTEVHAADSLLASTTNTPTVASDPNADNWMVVKSGGNTTHVAVSDDDGLTWSVETGPAPAGASDQCMGCFYTGAHADLAPVGGSGTYSVIIGGHYYGFWGRRIDTGVWENHATLNADFVDEVRSPPGFPDIVYGVYAGVQYQSTDGGVTWSSYSPTGDIAGGEAHWLASQTEWYHRRGVGAGTSNEGIWKSTDGGLSYSHLVSDSPAGAPYSDFGRFYDMYADGTYIWWPFAVNNHTSVDPNRVATTMIRRANADGSSVTNITGFSSPTTSTHIDNVRGDPNNPGTVVVWNNSTEGRVGVIVGTTLTEVTPSFGFTAFILGADIFNTTINMVVMNSSTGDGYIYRSTNSGSSWTVVAGPDADLIPWNWFEPTGVIACNKSDGQIWATSGADDVMWYSDDAGATWTKDILPGALGEQPAAGAIVVLG